MWDGFNKRKFPRLNLRCDIEIHSQEVSAPVRAMTQNVGVGGVCVLLDKPLERFSRCRLRLELGAAAQEVQCEGRVVWIVPTRDIKHRKTSYDTGVEFVDLAPERREDVRKFLENELTKS